MSKVSHLIKTVGLIGIGRLSVQLVALVLLPVYTTFLTPEEYGIVDLLLTYVTLASPFFTLQIEYGMFRFLIAERGRSTEIGRIIATATVGMTALGLIWLSIGLLVGIFLAETLVFYFLALLSSSMLFGAASQLVRGLGMNRLYAIANIVVAGSTLVSVGVFVWLDAFGFETYFWLMPACSLLGTLALIIGAGSRATVRKSGFDRGLLKRLVSYSLPLIPNSLAWWVISAAGRTVALIFLGPFAVGIYAVSTKFASMVTGLSAVFSYAWMESASMHIEATDRAEFFSRVVNDALRVFTALTLAIVAIVPLIFPLIIDDRFAEAYLYMPVLLVGALANAMVSFYSGVLIARQETKKVATTSVVAAVISLTISLALVQAIGLFAIGLGTAVAFAVMAIYRHLTIQSSIRIRYRFSTLVFVVLGIVVMLGLYYWSPSPWLTLGGGFLCVIVLMLPMMVTAVRLILSRARFRRTKN